MNSANTKIAVRPFVKWVGGKTQLIPQLVKYIPESYGTYYEPFLGGGAFFFHLQPKKACINDINDTLMFTYQVVKTDPHGLIKMLAKLQSEYTLLDEEGRRALFYEKREKYNAIMQPTTEKACLMIFLNKTCFNGLYRENSSGKFNVPFGSYKNPKICDEENILAVSSVLTNVTPSATDYYEVVQHAKKGDFIYFDPPYYPVSSTSSFTGYHGKNFYSSDQTRLRDVYVELDKRGCKVMLSNSATEYIEDLFKGYKIIRVKAARAINSKATGRGKIDEVVVINY